MTYTLVADGSSDEVLVPILNWSLRQQGVKRLESQWADFTRLPRARSLEDRLKVALDLFPCDVLFVHRDAEKQSPSLRRSEIASALQWSSIRHVPVVPVRMTEAWLLFDEPAIRQAADNPNGADALDLPDLHRIEDLPDPKEMLYEALRKACGLNARRRSGLRVNQRVHSIPNYIDDYSRLDALPAFRALQEDIKAVVASLPTD